MNANTFLDAYLGWILCWVSITFTLGLFLLLPRVRSRLVVTRQVIQRRHPEISNAEYDAAARQATRIVGTRLALLVAAFILLGGIPITATDVVIRRWLHLPSQAMPGQHGLVFILSIVIWGFLLSIPFRRGRGGPMLLDAGHSSDWKLGMGMAAGFAVGALYCAWHLLRWPHDDRGFFIEMVYMLVVLAVACYVIRKQAFQVRQRGVWTGSKFTSWPRIRSWALAGSDHNQVLLFLRDRDSIKIGEKFCLMPQVVDAVAEAMDQHVPRVPRLEDSDPS